MDCDDSDWTPNAAERVMGEFMPGNSPVIFNPLVTGNELISITYNHELAHQELTRKTAFGLFYEELSLLKHTKKFEPIAKLAKNAQWWTQEGAANYAGLITTAEYSTIFLSALHSLPSERTGGSPYREAFDLFAAAFLIEEDMPPTRLKTLRHLALGAARLSMDCDCLIRFLQPENITADKIEIYLEDSAPDVRLRNLLNVLTREGQTDSLIEKVQPAVIMDFDPTRVAMGAILEILGKYDAVSGIELRKQHAAFRIAWHSTIMKHAPSGQPARYDGFAKIFGMSKNIPAPLKQDDVRNIFLEAQNKALGLWIVVADNGESEALIDLLLYEQDEFGNPLSDESIQRAFQIDFRSARLKRRQLVQLFGDFPELPTAVTFMHGSWFYWQELFFQPAAKQNTVKVSMSKELSEVATGVMLGCANMISDAECILVGLDPSTGQDKPIFAFFVNRNLKNIYGIQYLPPVIGIELMDNLAAHFGVRPIPKNDVQDLGKIIPHFRLLEMMSMPANWGN